MDWRFSFEFSNGAYVIEVVNGTMAGDPLLPLVRITALYGLRRSELLGLQWDSIDFARGMLTTKQNAAIKRKPPVVNAKHLFKPDIDRSTEEWLGKLEEKLDYEVWYCGHYHTDKQIDKVRMMHNEIRPLYMSLLGEE